jgi:phage repressor protein C with HTH and peptisase S24 domain
MITPGTASTDLFLKRITVDDVIQGNEYVVAFGDRVVWRKIRMNKDDAEQWRLVSLDKEAYPDITINKSDIRALWRVIARMSILVS